MTSIWEIVVMSALFFAIGFRAGVEAHAYIVHDRKRKENSSASCQKRECLLYFGVYNKRKEITNGIHSSKLPPDEG